MDIQATIGTLNIWPQVIFGLKKGLISLAILQTALAGLLFAVLIIRGFIFVSKNFLSAEFTSIFIYITTNKQLFGHNSVPMLSSVLVSEGLSKNVNPVNNEGCLYYKPITMKMRVIWGLQRSSENHFLIISNLSIAMMNWRR